MNMSELDWSHRADWVFEECNDDAYVSSLDNALLLCGTCHGMIDKGCYYRFFSVTFLRRLQKVRGTEIPKGTNLAAEWLHRFESIQGFIARLTRPITTPPISPSTSSASLSTVTVSPTVSTTTPVAPVTTETVSVTKSTVETSKVTPRPKSGLHTAVSASKVTDMATIAWCGSQGMNKSALLELFKTDWPTCLQWDGQKPKKDGKYIIDNDANWWKYADSMSHWLYIAVGSEKALGYQRTKSTHVQLFISLTASTYASYGMATLLRDKLLVSDENEAEIATLLKAKKVALVTLSENGDKVSEYS